MYAHFQQLEEMLSAKLFELGFCTKIRLLLLTQYTNAIFSTYLISKHVVMSKISSLNLLHEFTVHTVLLATIVLNKHSNIGCYCNVHNLFAEK